MHVKDPRRDQYEEIFRRVASAMGVPYEQNAVDYLYHEYYGRRGISPRSCHPRDIIEHVCDTARYEGLDPILSQDILEKAASTYFLKLMEPDD
jgi:hypothetical protein